MKLLMISGDRSILQGKRGAFWYTLEELCKHWERIDVICPRANDETQDSGRKTDFPNVYFHPSSRGLWYQPWWILQKGSELISEHHHEVMTVHSYPPFYNDKGAMWLHKSSSVPFVLEVHHIVGYPKAASLSEKIGYWMSRWHLPRIARVAKVVRCVNYDVLFMLKSWGIPIEKLLEWPSLYLDIEHLQQDSSIKKTYDVVCCARFVKNKGLIELLTTIAALPKATLLLVGDGPLRSSLESLAKALGIEDRVTFAGWLEKNVDVYHAIQSAKIFVMNSKSEGGPRSAVEAMALGLPVISTQVGMMKGLIKDQINGVFVDGSSEDLTEKIRSLLLNDALRASLGKEAQEIKTRFHRSNMIAGYADRLKQAARR